MRAPHGRRRPVAASTALAVLATSTLLVLAAGGAGSPATAAPSEDCAPAVPVSGLAAGDPVTGLTVSDGTTTEGFTGELIGVLDDGIAPGMDMVLARLTSDEIDRVGGIWSGMSGSPVYDADGDLIGAVAYGLTWGSSPVAGITPFEEMDDYLDGSPTPPRRVPLAPRAARAIADQSEVTVRQAAQGMSQLRMPVGISGISQKRLVKARSKAKKHPYIKGPGRAVGGGASAAPAATADDITAGGNLAAAISYGDIAFAGVGTATSVCGGRVVGFGHPFDYAGPTTLSLHPASALYVQEDTLGSPFKVANVGAPVGTITDDRLSGITGVFGALPKSARISSTAQFEGRSRQGTSEVNLDNYTPDVTFFQTMLNQERVTDGWIGGSAEQTWTIVGTDARGKQFSVSSGDRFTSSDITFTSVWDLADLVWAISRQPDVSIGSVLVDADITTEEDTLRVSKVQQRRNGRWVAITRRSPAVVKAGATMRLRVSMTSPRGRVERTRVGVEVPRRASGQRAYLQVSGGSSIWNNAAWKNGLENILAAVENDTRNDEVRAQLRLLQPGRNVRVSSTSPEQELVVRGSKQALVRVR